MSESSRRTGLRPPKSLSTQRLTMASYVCSIYIVVRYSWLELGRSPLAQTRARVWRLPVFAVPYGDSSPSGPMRRGHRRSLRARSKHQTSPTSPMRAEHLLSMGSKIPGVYDQSPHIRVPACTLRKFSRHFPPRSDARPHRTSSSNATIFLWNRLASHNSRIQSLSEEEEPPDGMLEPQHIC